mgnify:CR=1 FL=1
MSNLKKNLNILIYNLYSQYKDYKNKFETDIDNVKNKIQITYDRSLSLFIIFIFLYYLKDFIFGLIRKFDTLL